MSRFGGEYFRILLGGDVISQPTPELVSRAGVSLVPEDRQVFPRLTVTENLVVATVAHKPGQWSVADVWRMFPRLEERRQARGSDLSGGEQQMLSIARALLCQPKVLLLDEPTEGLAPLTVASLTKSIQHIAESGVAVVLVEQNAKVPRKLANSFYVYDGGRVAWQGTGAELDEQSAIVNALLSF